MGNPKKNWKRFFFQNSITSFTKRNTKVNNKRCQCCDRSEWRLRDDCHTVRSYIQPQALYC